MTGEPRHKDVRLGLIGGGRWGKRIIETIGRIDGMTLTRLGSRDPQAAALAGPECEVFEDYHQVLNPNEIDGVIVASPAETHKDFAKRAISLGLPVFIEKPMTVSTEEAKVLLRAVSLAGGLVMVDHIHLFSPAFTALMELLGAVGPARFIRGVGGARAPHRQGFQTLWEWGPHDVSMTLAVMGGKPSDLKARVVETCAIDGVEGRTINMVLTFPEGAVADLTVGSCMDKTRRFEVHTDKVVLVYDDLAAHKLTLHPPTVGFAPPADAGEAVAVHPIAPLDVALITFANAINNQDEDVSALHLGHDVVEVLENASAALTVARPGA